jgi:sugar O-acyltransferase (sialic acid O-acetyltransferase NeuD family)
MSKDLIIVGDSLFAEIAHEYFTHDSDYDVVAFSVEAAYRRAETFRGLPVIPFEQLERECDPAAHAVYAALVYTQVNRLRTRLAAAAKAKGFALASYVSSRAFVWRNVQIGEHCFVFEDNTLQPFVSIGDNCVLWSGNHVGHHTTIRDNVFVASHAVISGSVEIGENSFVGVNATFANDIVIGADNWIGPNVVITRDTEPNSMWRPARSERRDKGTLELFGVVEDPAAEAAAAA